MARSRNNDFLNSVVKWVVIGLIILFIYEMVKQLKAKTISSVNDLVSAVGGAVQGVVGDLQNIATTAVTAPLSLLTELPSLVWNFFSGLLGTLFSSPVTFLTSLPTMLFNFLETLFGGTPITGASGSTPTIAQDNAFTGNDVLPNSNTASTSLLPTWLTTSPTTALPSVGSLIGSIPSYASTASQIPGNLDLNSGGFGYDLTGVGL
jgi:hypothetical protein